MPRLTPQNALIACLFLTVIAFASLQTKVQSDELMGDGVESQAVIVETTKKRTGSARHRRSKYFARVAIEGVADIQRGSISKSEWRTLQEGQSVPIYYSPSNPHNFIIGTKADADKKASFAGYVVPLGWIALLGALASGAFAARATLFG